MGQKMFGIKVSQCSEEYLGNADNISDLDFTIQSHFKIIF